MSIDPPLQDIPDGLAVVTVIVKDALAERCAHIRMDDDGAPPIGECPLDPYRELALQVCRYSTSGSLRFAERTLCLFRER